MALLYRSTLRPTKLELLAQWLPSRDWFQGQATAEVVRVANFRFDDPAGAVGIETMLVRAGDGPLHQVPLTYRDAPLAGADRWLIGTSDHSVLGQRWVYDACGDPVYAAALAEAIFSGTGQADEFLMVDGQPERHEPGMIIASRGVPETAVSAFSTVGSVCHVIDDDPTLIVTEAVELAIIRHLDSRRGPASASQTKAGLTGTWSGQETPVPLAYASLH